MFYFYFISILLLQTAKGSQQISLGAIFDQSDLLHRVIFAYAVQNLNHHHTSNNEVNHQWRARIDMLPIGGALKSYHKACNLLMTPVAAIFGPDIEPDTSQVQALCDAKEVPHIMTTQRRMTERFTDSDFSVNLFPPQTAVGDALAAVVKYYGWKSIVVLYEFNHALVDFQKLLANHRMNSFWQLPENGDYKPLLKFIKTTLRETRIVVHASLESSRKLMEQATVMKMTNVYHHYLFANLDIYTLDLEMYKANGCNITGLRFVDADSAITKDLIRNFRHFLAKERGNRLTLPTTSVAVLYDSVNIVAQGLNQLGNIIVPAYLSCSRAETWRHGSSLMNYIKTTEAKGVTGKIQLDNSGQRTNYELTVIELSKDGFTQLAKWNSSSGLNVTSSLAKTFDAASSSLENRTLRVTVIREEPFVMYKQSEKTLEGNDRFEGYCIDLLNELAQLGKFDYIIHEVKDKGYGAKDSHGNWNGMVGELERGEADMSVSSLTISFSRSEVVDFTVPFMHLGISILFKKPKKQDPGLFTFLSPLSLDVWIYMLAAYVCVSLILWLLARMSPYEWQNPHPCDTDGEILENQFSLVNSFWFSVASLMAQGTDLVPQACSTRVLAGFWWFFTLILVSSYTANLAAFLTVQRMVSPIENADDLAKQTKIKYGTLGRGSTMSFFKESKIATYERMWSFMSSAQPPVFVNSSREGIIRVKRSAYAYLMESSMLEYYVERDCDLMQIGGLIDSKGYGIGLPKGSPWREPISQAILRLQEKTVLTELKQRWWKERRGGGHCDGDKKQGGHNELGLKNVGGVFVVLLSGMVIALIFVIFELLYKARKDADTEKQSFWKEMCDQIQFAVRCHGKKKPKRNKAVIFNEQNWQKSSI